MRKKRVKMQAGPLGKTIGTVVVSHILWEDFPEDLWTTNNEVSFMIILSKSGSVAPGPTPY